MADTWTAESEENAERGAHEDGGGVVEGEGSAYTGTEDHKHMNSASEIQDDSGNNKLDKTDGTLTEQECEEEAASAADTASQSGATARAADTPIDGRAEKRLDCESPAPKLVSESSGCELSNSGNRIDDGAHAARTQHCADILRVLPTATDTFSFHSLNDLPDSQETNGSLAGELCTGVSNALGKAHHETGGEPSDTPEKPQGDVSDNELSRVKTSSTSTQQKSDGDNAEVDEEAQEEHEEKEEEEKEEKEEKKTASATDAAKSQGTVTGLGEPTVRKRFEREPDNFLEISRGPVTLQQTSVSVPGHTVQRQYGHVDSYGPNKSLWNNHFKLAIISVIAVLVLVVLGACKYMYVSVTMMNGSGDVPAVVTECSNQTATAPADFAASIDSLWKSKEFSLQSDRLWQLVKRHGRKHLERRSPNKPAVFLLAAPATKKGNRTVSCLAQQIARSFTGSNRSHTAVSGNDIRRRSKDDGNVARGLLVDDVSPPLSVLPHCNASQPTPNPVIVIEQLDRLPAPSPLFFHGVCDNTESPHPRAVVIFTVSVPASLYLAENGLSEKQKGFLIEDYLSDTLWTEAVHGEYSRGTVAALTTRICDVVVAVNEEDAVPNTCTQY